MQIAAGVRRIGYSRKVSGELQETLLRIGGMSNAARQ